MEKVFQQRVKGLEAGGWAGALAALLLFGCLCSTFVRFSIPDYSFSVYALSWTVLFAAVTLALLLFLCRKGGGISFSWIDACLAVTLAYFAARYDFDERLADWRVILLGLTGILWLLLRWLSGSGVLASDAVEWIVVGGGCVQAVWGLAQLYGLCPSNHEAYDMTGSFLNPGPFSGFVVIAVPVALHFCLQYADGVRHWVALAALLLMVSVLPAGMSRSAWMGGIIASALVINWHKGYLKWNRLKGKMLTLILLPSLALLVIGGSLLFRFKEDSIYGRLFIWENVCQASLRQPFVGHGSCSFPAVYAQAQADRFAQGDYTDKEEHVAGNPEYAFNEYLQIWLEYGLVGLLLFMSLLAGCMKRGLSQRRYGLCGGMAAFLLFAFTSYPFQYPSFWVALCLLLAGTVSNLPESRCRMSRIIPLFLLAVLGGLVMIQDQPRRLMETWEKCRMLRLTGGKEAASKGYERLSSALCHNPRFVFEYAQCLSETGRQEASNLQYERCLKLRCNSLVYVWMGENLQAMKKYEQAEAFYLKSAVFLPNRIYPYYRLAKLYAEPDFLYPSKFRRMAYKVLHKEPKVYSMAIDEMRTEIRQIAEKRQWKL